MKEIYKFRIDEREAHRLFADSEGVKASDFVRSITIAGDDERLAEIGRIRSELWDHMRPTLGSPFFFSWNVIREYSMDEIERANLFLLLPTAYFEPSGEECGTIYDEGAACPNCRAGASQLTALTLDISRIPARREIASTIGGELIVSRQIMSGYQQRRRNGGDLPSGSGQSNNITFVGMVSTKHSAFACGRCAAHQSWQQPVRR